jgi:hypothetical protein
MTYRLMYRSRFRPETGDVYDSLSDILKVSQRNNDRDGITGYLLFDRTHFVQTLEGDKGLVEQTFGCILRDPRHHEITVLARRHTAERTFTDWSMGGSIRSPEIEPIYLRHGYVEPDAEAKASPDDWLALAKDVATWDIARRQP